MTPRVAVLLSTYNGAAFLEAQLDSLLAQRGVEVEVFARDDGSSDATREILAGYAAHWPALAEVPMQANLGPAMSFLERLATAPEGFDGYAFCDQDDVWLPDKLSRAAARLAKVAEARPALYCSGVTCVDAELRPLGAAPIKDDPRFEHLIFENIAFGATVVMNPSAASLVRSRRPGSGVAMHDWWCALVTAAFGEVIYDPRPSVLYRQHGGNEIGQASARVGEIWRLMRKFAKAPRRFYPVHAQAAEFMRLWGDDLTPSCRAFVEGLVRSKRSFAGRIAYAASGKVVREGFVGLLATRALIAFGLY